MYPPPVFKFLGQGRGEGGAPSQMSTLDFNMGHVPPIFKFWRGGPLSNFRIGHEPPIFKFLEGGGPLSNFKIGHEPPIFKFLEGGPPPKKK